MALNILIVDATDDRRARALAAAFLRRRQSVWIYGRQPLYLYPEDYKLASWPDRVDLVMVHNNDRDLWTTVQEQHLSHPTAVINYSGAVPEASTSQGLWIRKKVRTEGLEESDIADIIGWMDSGCHPGLSPEILGGVSDQTAVLELLSTLQAFAWLSELHGTDVARQLMVERAGSDFRSAPAAIAYVVAHDLTDMNPSPPDQAIEYVQARLSAIVRERFAAVPNSPSLDDPEFAAPESFRDLIMRFRDAKASDWIATLTVLRNVLLVTTEPS